MHSRKISYASNSEFGVPVALVTVVSLTGVKTATRGRRRSSGSCYNRRDISHLGKQVASVKIGQYFHRYRLGDYVKLLIPSAPGI